MDEFSLIKTLFQRSKLTRVGGHLDKGIGDDCALVSVPPRHQLVQSIDTLVSGVHFPADGDPFLVGYRSLAVSVSDLAAMGATPHSFYLALTLPEADETWLQPFSDGLAEMAAEAGISLAGGDTTRGPLTISVLVQGFVPAGKALMRAGAKPGDAVYVSGTPGEACAALPYVLKQKPLVTVSEQAMVNRYWQPAPRIELGQWLLEHGATAAIDVSDGLLGDLGHILAASGCGADLQSDSVPLSSDLQNVSAGQALQMALTGGDDYELCFCWPQDRPLPGGVPVSVTKIGRITDAHQSVTIDGQPLAQFRKGVMAQGSYRHF